MTSGPAYRYSGSMRSIRAYLIGFLATAGLTVACSGGDGEGTDSSGECAGGEMQCDGMCVNTNIDEDNCGGCGITCNDGFVCAGGSCMADCAGGTSKCGEECVDLLDNVSNCGACGEACGTGEMCNLGVCTSCTAGETVCGNECVDTSVSNSHCGACDNACEPGEPCNDGACGLSCGAGETNCDGVCTDTDGDAANCGSCGNTCGVNQQCFDGVCVDPCAQDETLCDGECVDTSASAAHCGGCGSACGQDEVCVDGSCSPPCADDEALCGGVCVDPQSSPEHCGGCDNLCEYPNAAAVCELGVCALGMCDSGWADLDDDPGNGCEVEVPRRAFVTSVTYNGNLGGVAGADAKCQTLALSAGLGGTLSTTTYVTIASLQVFVLFAFWSPTGTVWWQASGPALAGMSVLYAASWLLLGKSMADAGLALQTGSLGWVALFRGVRPVYPRMPVTGLFRLTRQPIYVSFTLTLWTVPTWTPDQLVLALTLTAYCLAAPLRKEARFRRSYGADFDRYAREVPYWLPLPRRRR